MNTVKTIGVFFVSLLKPQPGRDWFIMFILAIIILVGVVGYSGYLFFGINTGRIVGVAATDVMHPPSVTHGDITKAIEAYKARVLNFNERNFPLPTLFDPSK